MLNDNNVKVGNWLFARRGELPIILLVLSILVIFADTNDIAWSNENWYRAACLIVSFFGLYIRCVTVGTASKNTSGRNTKVGQVADVVNTSGVYSIMRHPLYVGNYFMWLGICAYVGSIWFLFVFTLLYIIYYEKIMIAEETFLHGKFGKSYKEWSERVNAVIPNFKKWKPAAYPFCIRTVIRREYHGIFYLTISFILVNGFKNLAFYGSFTIDSFWIYFGAASFTYCLIVRILAKKTKCLHMEGRS